MAGVWPITDLRVRRGWGMVLEEDWPQVAGPEEWPPVEPPGLDEKAKRLRVLSYQRVRSAQECRAAIAAYRPVGAAFQITSQWFDAPQGVIPMPNEKAKIEGSHFVSIAGFSDAERAFYFDNSWGEEWGRQGRGQLSYEFFDRWMIDAWIMEGIGQYPPFATHPGIQELVWGIPDFMGRIVHVREYYDKSSDERMAWTFIVEREGFLDVEELFVRPQFRRQGYGSRLMLSLQELAHVARCPLRFWVPFADCAPGNLAIFERMLQQVGHSLHQTKIRWAAYCTEPRVSAERPPLPTPPSRPALLCEPQARAKQRNRPPTKGIPVSGTSEGRPAPEPVSEVAGLLQQPDWKTNSDKAFLHAAKSVFLHNASLLRRLA